MTVLLCVCICIIKEKSYLGCCCFHSAAPQQHQRKGWYCSVGWISCQLHRYSVREWCFQRVKSPHHLLLAVPQELSREVKQKTNRICKIRCNFLQCCRVLGNPRNAKDIIQCSLKPFPQHTVLFVILLCLCPTQIILLYF